MTGTAGSQKLTLRQMEEFMASHRHRFIAADGTPCQRAELLMDAFDHEALEQVNRFITWAIPHEDEIRRMSRGRK